MFAMNVDRILNFIMWLGIIAVVATGLYGYFYTDLPDIIVTYFKGLRPDT
ncbi:hypothetical protein DALLNEIH_03694 [Bacillus sp. B01(2024)]